MTEFVNVPVVLPDSLEDTLMAPMTGRDENFRELFWCNIKHDYEKIVAHYKANPVISDEAKGIAFWHAVACGEMGYEKRPEHVPSQINLKHDLSGPDCYLFGAGVQDCLTNPRTGTTVSLKADNGEWWSVHPRHFTVTKWRKNEEGEDAG